MGSIYLSILDVWELWALSIYLYRLPKLPIFQCKLSLFVLILDRQIIDGCREGLCIIDPPSNTFFVFLLRIYLYRRHQNRLRKFPLKGRDVSNFRSFRAFFCLTKLLLAFLPIFYCITYEINNQKKFILRGKQNFPNILAFQKINFKKFWFFSQGIE